MENYNAETYGERWAATYDAWSEERFTPAMTQAAVDALAEMAGSGTALELGIGTGRVALPLARRGVDVWGIDASPAMVDKLRQKPGGDAVAVTLGDFSDFDLDRQFDVIFVVFNTLFVLPTQEDQLRCFGAVARHLGDAGVFVIEAFVPDLSRYDGDQTVRALRITADGLVFDASLHDPVTQTTRSQHVTVTEAGIELRPIHIRYAWPSELDLMARVAGLQLQQRWGGWDRSPFTASSTTHISVYGRAS